MRRTCFVAVGLVLGTLAACAQNAVGVQSASSVAQLSSGVVRDVRAYFGGLAERRRESLVALVASDPNCRWGNSVQILVPIDTRVSAAPLCARGTLPAGYIAERLPLRGLPEEALQLATSELALVAAYHGALGSALEQQPSRFSEDLFFAVDLAAAVQTDVAKLAGTPIRFVSPEQATAARGLVTLVDTLRTEARQLDQVRAVVAREGVRVPLALNALQAQLVQAGRTIDTNSSLIGETGLTRYYNANAATLSYDERRRMLTAIAAAGEGSDQAQARIRPLLQAIVALRQSDRQLRDALLGRYTPQMQRQIALLNRKRLLQVVSLIAGLVPGAG